MNINHLLDVLTNLVFSPLETFDAIISQVTNFQTLTPKIFKSDNFSDKLVSFFPS